METRIAAVTIYHNIALIVWGAKTYLAVCLELLGLFLALECLFHIRVLPCNVVVFKDTLCFVLMTFNEQFEYCGPIELIFDVHNLCIADVHLDIWYQNSRLQLFLFNPIVRNNSLLHWLPQHYLLVYFILFLVLLLSLLNQELINFDRTDILETQLLQTILYIVPDVIIL